MGWTSNDSSSNLKGGTTRGGRSNVLGLESVEESSLFGQEKAGEFLKNEVFGPGNLYSWNELTRRATGEPLSAKYFAHQFVD